MRFFLPTILVSGLMAAVAGCAPGGQVVGCDFQQGGANGAEPRCQERTFIAGAEAFSGTCEVAQGVALDGPCPTEKRVAGCELDSGALNGSRVVDWYYEPETEETVKTKCEEEGSPFVKE